MAHEKPEIAQIQKTLKKLVKQKGLTYQELADHLSVSLSTANRVLNSPDPSLVQLIDTCNLLNLRFYELIDLVKQDRPEFFNVTLEQEQFLSENLGCWNYLRFLQRGLTVGEIASRYKVSPRRTKSILQHLEQNGFVQRGVNDKVRVIVKLGMDWHRNGPLEKAYLPQWLLDITRRVLKERKQGSGFLDFGHKYLSERSYQDLQKELLDIGRKYALKSRIEMQVVPKDDLRRLSYAATIAEWEHPMWTKV